MSPHEYMVMLDNEGVAYTVSCVVHASESAINRFHRRQVIMHSEKWLAIDVDDAFNRPQFINLDYVATLQINAE